MGISSLMDFKNCSYTLPCSNVSLQSLHFLSSKNHKMSHKQRNALGVQEEGGRGQTKLTWLTVQKACAACRNRLISTHKTKYLKGNNDLA